jgi:hypothetical protein
VSGVADGPVRRHEERRGEERRSKDGERQREILCKREHSKESYEKIATRKTARKQ